MVYGWAFFAYGPAVEDRRVHPGPKEIPTLLADVSKGEPALVGLEAALHDQPAVHQSSCEGLMPSLPVLRAAVLGILPVALAAVAFVDLIGK